MKILFVKTSSLGDIIHVLPTLQYLKKNHVVQIDWVVEKQFSEILINYPLVDNVIVIDSKLWKEKLSFLEKIRYFFKFRKQIQKTNYDILFDFQGNIKSSLITAIAKAKDKVGFGWRDVPEWPNILVTNHRYNIVKNQNIRQDYLRLVKCYFNDDSDDIPSEGIDFNVDTEEIYISQLLEKIGGDKRYTIMVCPGTRWKNKQLPMETLIEFLKDIYHNDAVSFLLVWGNDKERYYVDQINKHFSSHCMIVNKLSLPVLQRLMSRVDLVIAMDSLPLHLCGTTQTSSFSIFGASLAEKYKPFGARHYYFQGKCPYGEVFDKRCSRLRTCKNGDCVGKVTIKQLKQIWDGIKYCR